MAFFFIVALQLKTQSNRSIMNGKVIAISLENSAIRYESKEIGYKKAYLLGLLFD
jgi:hypothetical protein